MSRSGSRYRAIGTASLLSVLGVMPVSLLGALAVLISAELRLSEAEVGVAVSIYWASAALCSVSNGRLLQRLGDRTAFPVAATASSLALCGLAVVWSWPALLAALVLAGAAGNACQLAANQRLSAAVPPQRLGLGFGVKQSAMPAAMLLGGFSLPIVATTLGWRSLFAATGVAGLAVAGWLIARRAARRGGPPPPRTGVRLGVLPLLVLGAAFFCAIAATTAMAAYLVLYGAAEGHGVTVAGGALAAGSAASILARILCGLAADARDRDMLPWVAAMLGIGALATIALGLSYGPAWYLVAAGLSYGIGWGWPGLFHLAIVRGYRHSTAAATGITEAGGSAGGVAGPLIFGLVAATASYRAAWWVAAAGLMVAAVLMLVGAALVRRAAGSAARGGHAYPPPHQRGAEDGAGARLTCRSGTCGAPTRTPHGCA